MRSHTVGAMSIGHGAVYSTSIRPKINTKSSTEAELVGMNDLMGQVLWNKAILEDQEPIWIKTSFTKTIEAPSYLVILGMISLQKIMELVCVF
jgi:hypothetical protein